MIVGLPGLVGSHGGGNFPPAGTLLSSVCSGRNGNAGGATDYYDVNGTLFVGMFTLYEELADGSGGSYWVIVGDNTNDSFSSCWLPQFFYTVNGSNPTTLSWSGCGSSGTFQYGTDVFFTFYNGDGTETGSGYHNDFGYSSGYTIYDNNSGCCYVYYDGNGGYYVSDSCGGGCPAGGNYSFDGCVSFSGNDASGQYWDGTWAYAYFYTDGNCGYYPIIQGYNSNGCYFPYGYWVSYNFYPNSFDWGVYDSSNNFVSGGNFTYSNSYDGNQADGFGSTNYRTGGWMASGGDLIASGSYYDMAQDTWYNYEVRFDGGIGYYVITF